MKKGITIISIIGAALIIGFTIFISCVSFSNTEISLSNQFKQKMTERTAFYDKMWKTLSQKSQVALRNDSSFSRQINVIMAGRKDSGLMVKWVKETNPNANYQEVSKLYSDLSNSIEGERNGFLMQEKMIQGIVLEHNNLIQKWPGSMWNSIFYKREVISYKPITSDRTDDVMATGKDNNTKLF